MTGRPRRLRGRITGGFRRRPGRRRWPWIAATLVLLLVVIADQRGLLLVAPGNDLATYDGQAAVVARVVDGDTIDVRIPDARSGRETTRLQLWGVDCPEAAAHERPAEPWADEATGFVRRLALDQSVRLRLEPSQARDRFDRVLAHVTLPDGRSLNESLLLEGLAAVDDRWPHALLGRYAQLELAARRRGAGIWSTPAHVAARNEKPLPDR